MQVRSERGYTVYLHVVQSLFPWNTMSCNHSIFGVSPSYFRLDTQTYPSLKRFLLANSENSLFFIINSLVLAPRNADVTCCGGEPCKTGVSLEAPGGERHPTLKYS